MAVPARRLDEISRRRPPAARRPSRSTSGRRVAGRTPVARGAPRRRGGGSVAFLLVCLVVVGGLLVGLAAGHALIAQGSLRLDDLHRRSEELRLEQDRLRLRLAELSSPERIIRAARRRGLVLPDRVEILTVRGGGTAASPRHPGTLAGGALEGEG